MEPPPPLSSTAAAVMPNPTDRSLPSEEGGTSTFVRSSSPYRSVISAERLTDDLLVEILSRVPAKSLCRFKCVSCHWLNLIDHPHHRKKLPQPMAGIFSYCNEIGRPRIHFANVMRSCRTLISTSLAFLPNHREVCVLDSCNGLLLCSGYGYVVCNPATEKWVTIPDPIRASDTDEVHLGFDSSVSSHFHVFALLEMEFGPHDTYLCGVEVYSSETGSWVHKEDGWKGDIIRRPNPGSATVFLNGYLHFHFSDDDSDKSVCLAAVDTNGETLTKIRVPGGINHGYIQQSQGYLHYTNLKKDEDSDVHRLLVYVLKDYGTKEWTLKHSVETSYLFGERYVIRNGEFDSIVIPPDCNLIFVTRGQGISVPH